MNTRSASLPGAFAAHIRGMAMAPRVHDGALCLFRRPGRGNRAGRLFVVEHRGEGATQVCDLYLLRLLEPTTRRGRRLVTLRTLCPDMAPVVVDLARDYVRVIAELVRVLPTA